MKWDHLAEGIDVLRFWRAVPPEKNQPEVAVLRLSHKRFRELQKEPKQFINGHKIFDKDVRLMNLEPTSELYAENSPILVVVAHQPDCRASGASVADMPVAVAA